MIKSGMDMKLVVMGAIILCGILPTLATAQRSGGGRGGGGRGGGFSGGRGGSIGLPPVGPIPPLGPTVLNNHFRNFGRGGGGGFGLGYLGAYEGSGYAGYPDTVYQIPVLLPQQESCPASMQPPPPPVQSQLHEYKWPDSGDTAAQFAIISKNGEMHSAVAVWVQGNNIHYVKKDDTAGVLALDSVDREATDSANAARHLVLPLPAANSRRR